jgi:hypothetical protein
MRFINKKIMLFMTNVFLLAGIGSTIANYSTSVLQGEALSRTKVALFGTSNLTSGWVQSGFTPTQGTDYVRFRTNETNFVSTSSKSSLIDPLEQFTSSLTITFKVGSFGGTGTSGFLRAEILNSSNTVLNSATGSFTLNNADESYIQGSSITLTLPENPSDIDKFKLILHSSSGFTDSKYMRFQELTITYSSELITTYDDATTFATTLLNSTNDKENCLSDDNWTTLSSSYTNLSSDAKIYFQNTTTNQTILNARNRYNYLRSFNISLPDFIFGS